MSQVYLENTMGPSLLQAEAQPDSLSTGIADHEKEAGVITSSIFRIILHTCAPQMQMLTAVRNIDKLQRSAWHGYSS